MRKAYRTNSGEIRLKADEHRRSRFAVVMLAVVVLAIAIMLVACAQQSQATAPSGGAVQQVQANGLSSEAGRTKETSEGAAGQAAASQPTSQHVDAAEAEGAAEAEVYEPDVVLVSLKEGADVQEALRVLEQETGMAGLSIASEGEGYAKLALPEDVTVEQAVEALGQSTAVESAQPNFRYYLMDGSEDEANANTALNSENATNANAFTTAANAGANQLQVGVPSGLFTQSVELNDPYALEGKLWGLSSVRALDAWDVIRCNHSVSVAIIDNVFLASHEDLKNNVAVAYNAVTSKENDDVAGSKYEGTDEEHGTHVAGIIAAQANNGKGVAGVSYNARLLLMRTATDGAEFYTDALLNAYNYIISNKDVYNVHVVNMSLGGYMENDDWLPDGGEAGDVQTDAKQSSGSRTDDVLLQAIDRAWDAGIITVTSAGNAGSYGSTHVSAPFSCYPGDYDRCVNVMNLYMKKGDDETGDDPLNVARNSGSNFNIAGRTNKDISAPGSTIYSTGTDSTSSYRSSTGTSMSAPYVAGVLALMFATYPDLTAEQAVQTLYETARDLGDEGFDEKYGYGEVDALAAVEAVKEIAEEAGHNPSSPDEPADGPDAGDDPSADDVPAAKKLRNTLTVQAQYPKVKASALKTKSKTIARKMALTIKKARGTLTYRKLSGSSRLKIAKETGKITIKKGTKRGTYRMQVRVRAAGNDEYKPRVIDVTVRIRVR